MKEYKPTHRALCTRSALWLNGKGYHVALIERKCQHVSEEPDVIGFQTNGFSHLLEIKVSRADFLSDLKKRHRQEDYPFAMGELRSYVCPAGIISPDELPLGWGLFYATHSQFRQQHNPDLVKKFDANKAAEMALLLGAYRQIKTGVVVTGEPQ